MVELLDKTSIKFRKLKPVRVSKKIESIHFKDRKVFDLVVGAVYYVCWGSNVARPCILQSIDPIREFGEKTVHGITILAKQLGRGSDYSTHSIYADEIGRTPQEAVVNTVTN